jgi:adenosylcobyric acid synthase
MHIGRTTGPATAKPLIRFDNGRLDGAVSGDGQVAGTYVHGVFAEGVQRAKWLGGSSVDYAAGVEAALDALAAHVEAHVRVDRLLSLAR